MSTAFDVQYETIQRLEDQFWQQTDVTSWGQHFERLALQRPNKIAITEVSGSSITYQSLNELANCYAAWALTTQQRFIGVLLPNNGHFLAAVIGLAKVNVVAVLLPHTDPPKLSRKTALDHGVMWIITDTHLSDLCTASPSTIENTFTPEMPLTGFLNTPTLDSTALIIFTSGTTGRRKAALFSHRRLLGAGIAWSLRAKLTADDRVYICLPLFHGNALAVAFSACVQAGGTAIIKKRFSASELKNDLQAYACTAMVYIGELWRLIDQIPPQASDTESLLRVIFGNGLTKQLWKKTVARFNIELVVEHYGAIEMPASALTNWTNNAGYCGFIPPGHADENDVCFVDEHGNIAGSSASGELLLRVRGEQYSGYLDTALNHEKIIKLPPDMSQWWRSGDYLSRNSEGYFTFLERAKESFRWKGENIPWADIEDAIYDTGIVKNVALVGVKIPHHEGKAGMALIIPKENFNVAKFNALLRERVMPQALPCLLSVRKNPPALTPTLKIIRQKIIDAGWQSANFALHQGRYIRFTRETKDGFLAAGHLPDFRSSIASGFYLTTASVTRLYDGPRGLPAMSDIQSWAENSTRCSKHVFAAVDRSARQRYGEYLERMGIELLDVNCWEKITPALNTLLHCTNKYKLHYFYIQSVDIRIEAKDFNTLLSHLTKDTLVVGLRVAHTAEKGILPLTGASCPWNTCAVWNVDKLSLTGFLTVADALREPLIGGMEEAAVIALHQRLFPLESKAKLLDLNKNIFSTTSGSRFASGFEEKLTSKCRAVAAQLTALNLHEGHIHALGTSDHEDL